MSCYCSARFTELYEKVIDVKFTEFNKDGKPDETLYCKEWATVLGIQ